MPRVLGGPWEVFWVVRMACLVLLSSFYVQDSSKEEGGAHWSWSEFSVRDLY